MGLGWIRVWVRVRLGMGVTSAWALVGLNMVRYRGWGRNPLLHQSRSSRLLLRKSVRLEGEREIQSEGCGLVLCCLVLSSLVFASSVVLLSSLVLSSLVLSCARLVFSCFVLCCGALNCLPCLVLSCLVLSCLALSCLVCGKRKRKRGRDPRPSLSTSQ